MRVIYGKVFHATSGNTEGCKCNLEDARLYVNIENAEENKHLYSINIVDLLSDYQDSISFYVLDSPLENMEFGDFMGKEADLIHDMCLERYILSTMSVEQEEVYGSTCYSEYTCGYPGEVFLTHIEEAKSLEDRIVAFIFK